MSAVLIVLRGAEVFAPAPLGRRDVVLAGERILAVAPPGIAVGGLDAETVDLAGRRLAPGFIDNHVHVLGGGGGSGFASRAPEIQASQLARAGITGVVGMLGFDATTKSMAGLVAKTKALSEDGLNAWCLTGATLEHPVPTLTGRIRTDIAFVKEIIGVGEISISELGSNNDSFGAGAQYLAEAVTEGMLAGGLAGKSGYACLQVPPYGRATLKPIFEVLDRTGLPIGQFLPSHVNQSDGYLHDAAAWGRRGGWVDVGTNYDPALGHERAIPPGAAVLRLIAAGVPGGRILLSSDGNGAVPRQKARDGRPTGSTYLPVGTLWPVVRGLIVEAGMAPGDALALVTANVAAALGLADVGRIAPGASADFVVLDRDWSIVDVWARGRRWVADGRPARRGMFDDILLGELG